MWVQQELTYPAKPFSSFSLSLSALSPDCPLPQILSASFTVWIFLLLVEEGLALAQKAKGKIDKCTLLLGWKRRIKSQGTLWLNQRWEHRFSTFNVTAAAQVSSVLTLLRQVRHKKLLFYFFHACLGSRVHPDGDGGSKGVKPSQRPQNSRHCGNWIRNADGGTFSSPNYPKTYPPNKECLYVLEGNQQRVLEPQNNRERKRGSGSYFSSGMLQRFIRLLIENQRRKWAQCDIIKNEIACLTIIWVGEWKDTIVVAAHFPWSSFSLDNAVQCLYTHTAMCFCQTVDSSSNLKQNIWGRIKILTPLKVKRIRLCGFWHNAILPVLNWLI